MTTQFKTDADRMTDTLQHFSKSMEDIIWQLETEGCDKQTIEKIRSLLQDEVLSKDHIERFCWNLRASGERLLATRFNIIPIEPIIAVSDSLGQLGYAEEAYKIKYIHAFALAVRQWYRAKSFNNGPAIKIKNKNSYICAMDKEKYTWHSVAEGDLPEPSETDVILIFNGKIQFALYLPEWGFSPTYVLDEKGCRHVFDKVTYWMPIPDVPGHK